MATPGFAGMGALEVLWCGEAALEVSSEKQVALRGSQCLFCLRLLPVMFLCGWVGSFSDMVLDVVVDGVLLCLHSGVERKYLRGAAQK